MAAPDVWLRGDHRGSQVRRRLAARRSPRKRGPYSMPIHILAHMKACETHVAGLGTAPPFRRDREILWGGRRGDGNFVAACNRWSAAMPLGPLLSQGQACIRFLFVGSPFCRRLPPHPASLRRSCLWLAVPLLAARRGLDLQVQDHAWHTWIPAFAGRTVNSVMGRFPTPSQPFSATC